MKTYVAEVVSAGALNWLNLEKSGLGEMASLSTSMTSDAQRRRFSTLIAEELNIPAWVNWHPALQFTTCSSV